MGLSLGRQGGTRSPSALAGLYCPAHLHDGHGVGEQAQADGTLELVVERIPGQRHAGVALHGLGRSSVGWGSERDRRPVGCGCWRGWRCCDALQQASASQECRVTVRPAPDQTHGQRAAISAVPSRRRVAALSPASSPKLGTWREVIRARPESPTPQPRAMPLPRAARPRPIPSYPWILPAPASPNLCSS